VDGDDTRHNFPVKIAGTESVGTLRDFVKEKKPLFDHVPADALEILQVSLPSNDLDAALKRFRPEHNSKKVVHLLSEPIERVQRVFEDPIDEDLHVIVGRPDTGERQSLWFVSISHYIKVSVAPTILALWQDFSRLYVDDPDVSIESIDLPRVSAERDMLTDEDHKALDARILTTFNANKQLKQEPDLPSLLWNIANTDKRLKTLTTDEAGELLARWPSMKTVLRNTWRKEAFKEVRQLGAFM
jgi:hypothetical protein